MSQLPTIPDLIVRDGAAFASSLDVARVFGKRHDDVLRRIDTLAKAIPDPLRIFAEGSYTRPDTGSQVHRCFDLSRDAFTLLAMGFTGAKALQFKLAYIAKFNAMEAELRERKEADFFLPQGSEPLTREQFRDDLKITFKHFMPQVILQVEQRVLASLKTSMGKVPSQAAIEFALGTALDKELPRLFSGVKGILRNQDNWRAAGLLPTPLPTDETTYVTSTEVCWLVVPDPDLHRDMPGLVGKRLLSHSRKNRWPQGEVERRTRRDRPIPTYPLSRVKEWLVDGGKRFIEAENARRLRWDDGDDAIATFDRLWADGLAEARRRSQNDVGSSELASHLGQQETVGVIEPVGEVEQLSGEALHDRTP